MPKEGAIIISFKRFTQPKDNHQIDDHQKEDHQKLQHDIAYLLNAENGQKNQLLVLEGEVKRLTQREKQLTDVLFFTRGVLGQALSANADQLQKPALKEEYFDLEQSLRSLEGLAPAAYQKWSELLSVNAEEYLSDPTFSCSVEGNHGAVVFKSFISIYLSGTVLDIGCGPMRMPAYLEGYPPQLICGIDPIAPHGEQDFAFMQNISEFLPWQDGSFDTVLIGTSFDHVLLLDKALEEIKRVLKPKGTLLVWTNFKTGSKKYDPYVPSIEPVDRYHLFRFDQPWFEEMMREFGFITVEHYEENSHYYAFKLERSPT